MAFTALFSSLYDDGGKLKFVGSGFTFNLASPNGFAFTGERGAKSGEDIFKDAGGGVGIGKLEGVLPAAAFFSICKNVKNQLPIVKYSILLLPIASRNTKCKIQLRTCVSTSKLTQPEQDHL